MKELRPALASSLLLTVVAGLVYPGLITLWAGAFFPRQAGGSLLTAAGKVVGSRLVGQVFTAPGDFWGRPSATTDSAGQPRPCDAASSGGSNLAPADPELRQAVAARIAALGAAGPPMAEPIPVDLVTASGSGLDPHISPAAAAWQVERVARARGLSPARIRTLLAGHTEGRQWGFLGEPRVNVLELNLALDAESRATR